MTESGDYMAAKRAQIAAKNPPRLSLLIQVFVASFLLLPSTAHAYVDPGSGSVIVTTILGLVAAVGYTFRKYFFKLKRSITGGKPQDDHVSDD